MTRRSRFCNGCAGVTEGANGRATCRRVGREISTRGGMAKGNDAVTKEEKRAASAPASGDKYPGIEGATRGEVDAFLEALDEFQPVVRVCVRRRVRVRVR